MAQYQVPYQTEQDVNLAQMTRQAVRWLGKNGKYLLLGLIVGAVAGFIQYKVVPPRYEGRMIGYANNLNDIRIREFIADLDNLRRGSKVKELAKGLSLTEAEAATLGGFEVTNHAALEADLPYPPRETQTYFFAIDVHTTKPALFPKIQRGIVSYINNSSYVKKLLRSRNIELSETVKKIQQEQDYLENVKQQQLEAVGKGNVMLGDFGAISVHIVDLEEKKEFFLAKLRSMTDEVVITKDIAVNPKPVTPGPIRATVAGGAYGLALAIAILAIVGLARMARE